MEDENVSEHAEPSVEFEPSEEAKELVGERFSLIERLQGRNLPHDVVTIYIDDESAYKLQRAEAAAAGTTDKAELAKLDKEIKRLKQAVLESAVRVHLTALSAERYDAIVAETDELFPIEYDETVNPITGRKQRTERENPDRFQEFLNRQWAASIQKVTMSDGSYDDSIDLEWAHQFMRGIPLNGVNIIQSAIEDLRMQSNWMEQVQSSDF